MFQFNVQCVNPPSPSTIIGSSYGRSGSYNLIDCILNILYQGGELFTATKYLVSTLCQAPSQPELEKIP